MAHTMVLLPVVVHASFVYFTMLNFPQAVDSSFAIVMLTFDCILAVSKSWLTLNDSRPDAERTEPLLTFAHSISGGFVAPDSIVVEGNDQQPFSFGTWMLQWSSIITTAIITKAFESSIAADISFAAMLLGGASLAIVSPRCNLAAKPVKMASRFCALFAVVVDAVPLILFSVDIYDLSTTFADNSSNQGAQEVAFPLFTGFIFVYKALVCLRYVIFEPVANRSNAERKTWVPDISNKFHTVWAFVLWQGFLTAFSIGRGLKSAFPHTSKTAGNSTETAGSRPANFCVNTTGQYMQFDDKSALHPFQCMPPSSMASLDSLSFLACCTVFMLFVGEYVNQIARTGNKVGDPDARWPNTCIATLTENVLQILLSGQVLYAMLRLRVELDPLYVCYVTYDLLFILLLMLTRQLREDYGNVSVVDWGVMFLLEAWDVANSLVVVITLAHETDHSWPSWVVDAYCVLFILTLVVFQMSYPFWTSLKRIAWISCFNDIVTDGPMIVLVVRYELYDKNTICAMAVFVNICIISFALVIWPLKYYIQHVFVGEFEHARDSLVGLQQAPRAAPTAAAAAAGDAKIKRKLLPAVAVVATLLATGVIVSAIFVGWWNPDPEQTDPLSTTLVVLLALVSVGGMGYGLLCWALARSANNAETARPAHVADVGGVLEPSESRSGLSRPASPSLLGDFAGAE